MAGETLTSVGDAYGYRIAPYADHADTAMGPADWRILADTAGPGGFGVFSPWSANTQTRVSGQQFERMQEGTPQALWVVVRENPGTVYAGIEPK